MDYLLVSTNVKQQEHYWDKHLKSLFGPNAAAIHEDWPGGAGSALGTLYAYKKGAEKLGIDLLKKQQEGASIGIYHTAGKGSRLCPLTLSERNNKSAVIVGGGISLLEAIIQQSLPLGKKRPGRLSVFWGDQIFLTSEKLPRPEAAIELFVKGRPMPSEEVWQRDRLSYYGIVAEKRALEKIDYTTLCHLTNAQEIATSLGSFSLSAAMTELLLDFFAEELNTRSGKLDVEPHLWMPLTLNQETFSLLGGDLATFHRMQRLREKIREPLFATCDIGKGGFFWDYGNVTSYMQNQLKLLGSGAESEALRQFYGNRESQINCKIGSGTIKNSLLIGVEAEHLDVEDCVIINTKVGRLSAKGSLLYNVHEKDPLNLPPGTVRSDTLLPDTKEHIPLYSTLERDGKADWEQCLGSNRYSYADLFTKNLTVLDDG